MRDGGFKIVKYRIGNFGDLRMGCRVARSRMGNFGYSDMELGEGRALQWATMP